jgi:hypothetical protein
MMFGMNSAPHSEHLGLLRFAGILLSGSSLNLIPPLVEICKESVVPIIPVGFKDAAHLFIWTTLDLGEHWRFTIRAEGKSTVRHDIDWLIADLAVEVVSVARREVECTGHD